MQALSIYAPQWSSYDSYGILARHLAAGLERQGLHANRLGIDHPPGSVRSTWGGLLLGYPTLYAKYGPLAAQGRRVALTMFESSQIPEAWVKPLNGVDAVIVPAEFLVAVLRQCGVEVPIHVVPQGIDAAYKQVERRPREGRPFTFLAIADRGLRKGWGVAWHAFSTAFGDNEAYRLILKSRAKGMASITSGDRNVEILQADLSTEEMAELYARCDCMIFPTRGEGFGLPPREFAATGGTALATRWGGTADCLDRWGYGIPYRMTAAWPNHEQFRSLGQWAEPDVQRLRAILQAVVRLEAALARKALMRQTCAQALYDWQRFADEVLRIYCDGT